MNKIIFTLALAVIFPISVSALVEIPAGTIAPEQVAQSWGLTGAETPKVARGVTVTDRYGFSATCNEFWGCYDISNTESYLQEIVKVLSLIR